MTEKKSVRWNVNMTPDAAAVIKKAALAVGLTPGQFMVMTAIKAAAQDRAGLAGAAERENW